MYWDWSLLWIAKRTSRILLEAAPAHVDLDKVKEDLLTVRLVFLQKRYAQSIICMIFKLPDVLSIHDLHVWYLSQSFVMPFSLSYSNFHIIKPSVILASFHVLVHPETTLTHWEEIESSLRECLAAYGVNHVTVEPELYKPPSSGPIDYTSTDLSDLKIKPACEDMGCAAGVNAVALKSLRNRHSNAHSSSH